MELQDINTTISYVEKISDALPSLIKWISKQRNGCITFKQYFQRKKIQKMGSDAKEKALKFIDGEQQWDGRRLIVDYDQRKIYTIKLL